MTDFSEFAYLLEKLGREIATLERRVKKAEADKESLKASLVEISGFSAYWKCLRGNEEAWENVWNIATDALISLRTAEESSVVERMTKLEKLMENPDIVREVIMEHLKDVNNFPAILIGGYCPSEFEMDDHCSEYPNCEWCWGREVEELAS